MGIKKSTDFTKFYTGLVGLIFLFTASLVFSEQNTVKLKILPQNPVVDKEFRVEIYVYGNFFTGVSVLPPEKLGVFTITGGPYIRPDISKNGIIITFTIKGKRKGKHLLGSFLIRSGSSRVKTEPLLLNIISVKQEAVWKVPKGAVYIGEAIPVRLELSLWNVPEIPSSVYVRVPEHALLEEFKLKSGIREDTEDERKHFTVPLKGYLVTPLRTGFLKLPPARVLLSGNRKYYSKSVTLRVIPLPKSVRRSKAVGDFLTEYSLYPVKVSMGKEITVTVTLSGRGNFNYLKLPVPEISGKPLKRTERINKFYAAEDGYRGLLSESYKIQLKTFGTYKCIIPSFYYIDDKTKRVKKIASRKLEFTVIKGKNAEPAGTAEDVSKWPIININNSRMLLYNKMYRMSWVYLLFLPGPLLIVIFIIIGKITKKRHKWKLPVLIVFSFLLFNGNLIDRRSNFENAEIVQKAIKYYEDMDYKKALNIFLKMADQNNNPDVLFDIAACYNELGNSVKAIHYLRKMLKLNPSNRLAKKYLSELEHKKSLNNQIPASIRLNPNYLFILEILIFNLFCVFLVLYLNKRNIRIVLFLIVLSIVFFISAGYLIYSVNYINKKTGIIAVEQGHLKKIPESIANTWVTLKGGTALEVLESAGKYRLIKTGDGLLGWVLSDSILLD